MTYEVYYIADFFYFYINHWTEMLKISQKYLFLLFILAPVLIFSQNTQRIDSLLGSLSQTKDDTQRCDTYKTLFNEYIRNNIDKARYYNELGLNLARKIHYSFGIAEAIYNLSSVYRIQGKYDSALAIMAEAKSIYITIPDSNAYADCLGDIGYLYTLKNDAKNALINLIEAREIYRKTGGRKNLALLYNRFASLYQSQNLFDSALAYYKKSLEINEATGFRLGCSVNLINMGNIYEAMHDYKTAISYCRQALEIKEKLGDKQGIGKCLNNIGAAYMNLGKVDSAIEYHEKALAIATECNGFVDIAMGYINLGFDYQKGRDYRKAVTYASKGLEMAKKANDLVLTRESARVLFESYESLNNYRDAFRYHTMFMQYSDSIVNKTNLKALTEIEAKYNMVSKEKVITDLKIDKNRQELKLQTLKGWYYLGIALFLALLMLALFFYYRSRVSRKLSQKLKEINEMKSHFFANLSHEFRTPLTLMLGPAEKLMETARPEDKVMLEMIHRNASRLLFLDEQLLEFTRIDSGNEKLRLFSGNILLPLKALTESFFVLAEQKDLQFSCSFPEEPVEAFFDTDILEKVTGNLLSNAFKYTPAGGSVKLSVSAGKQSDFGDVRGQGEPGLASYVRIDVRDTGIGIPDDKKELIFERFFQLNHNPGNTTGGVGIGLALTKELCKLHHGTITVESTVGKGSLFSIYLPLNTNKFLLSELKESKTYVSPEQNTYHPEPVMEALTENWMVEEYDPGIAEENSLPLVLVVDDNKDMRTYIREILSDRFQVMEAESGDTGFREACTSVPDLIITDVMMYPVNGMEFCRNLKIDESTSHIPVIMLTALSGSQEKIEGLETGADDYITKPFNTRELLARIDNLVNQRKKLRQLFSSAMNIEPGAISVTSADEKFLKRLISLTEDNIDNPDLDIEFLLRNISMSRSQLHRKIKGITGQPITGFIRIIRIKRAAQLMEKKFGNVSEIMYAVGFNNLSYFTKSFRSIYNMTPSEFMAK